MVTTRNKGKDKFSNERKFAKTCDSSISASLLPKVPNIKEHIDMKYNIQLVQKCTEAIIASMVKVVADLSV